MEALITLVESYSLSSIVIFAVLLFLAIRGINSAYTEIKAWLKKYYDSKKEKDEKAEAIDDRLRALEEAEEQDKVQLKELKELIEETRKAVNSLKDNQNEVNKAQAQSSMYRLATELIRKGYMSQTESETLDELTRIYMISCGRNYITPPIIERAMKLDVLTDEEIENKKKQINSLDK